MSRSLAPAARSAGRGMTGWAICVPNNPPRSVVFSSRFAYACNASMVFVYCTGSRLSSEHWNTCPFIASVSPLKVTRVSVLVVVVPCPVAAPFRGLRPRYPLVRCPVCPESWRAA